MKSCKKRKKVFSMFKLLSTAMAVAIILTGCTGTPGADGRDGVDGRDGKDGKTPTITINSDGYWVINREVTTHKAVGSDGKNGVNGKNGKDGKDGKDGETPTITINKDGYWVINGEATNIKAKGNDGKPGSDGKDGKDGEDGQNGTTPTIEINEEGYWVINGEVTEYKAVVDSGNDDNDSSETEPVVMEGDGQTFHRFAPSALSFRSTAPLDEFQEVQVNGETVDPSNYTLTEGSTIVTFNIDYLKTLDVTQHEVTVVSDSVSANANFEVLTSELSEYGFYYNQPYMGYVDALGRNVVFFFRKYGNIDLMLLGTDIIKKATYTFVNDILTTDSSYGVFTGTVSETEIYFNELDTTFKLGDESVAADDDYIYVYNEELSGYEVNAIDKTKDSYSPIRTGINGIPTVKIANNAFLNNKNLTTRPIIPDSVTSIGTYAFAGCESLTSVIIPDSVTSIGDSAFRRTGLESLIIPDSVTSIGSYAFSVTGIKSIIIPKSVMSVGEGAFYECTSLENVTIENGVTSIGVHQFGLCSNLISITIPTSVTEIGNYAFFNSTSLSTINYRGTQGHWNVIEKGSDWDYGTPSNKVINYNYVG